MQEPKQKTTRAKAEITRQKMGWQGKVGSREQKTWIRLVRYTGCKLT